MTYDRNSKDLVKLVSRLISSNINRDTNIEILERIEKILQDRESLEQRLVAVTQQIQDANQLSDLLRLEQEKSAALLESLSSLGNVLHAARGFVAKWCYPRVGIQKEEAESAKVLHQKISEVINDPIHLPDIKPKLSIVA